jgi:hypothetical protein
VIIEAAPREAFGWLSKRTEIVPSLDFKAIVAHSDGRIHGMAGFDGWTENSVVVSIALDNPAALRGLILEIFRYVFVQANRGVMLAMVRSSNVRSARLCSHVGLREVYRVRDGIRVGEDIVIFEMRREDCRWIAAEHRKAA